ncbi:MAG: PSD1 and planctomycete cytochrome C domain-containing protein [Verrucomicrobiota bacterium]|nr:PSD1 and planctomycete cytochrome C domain-containing protein [Verrucomicrobiota bacterium]
MRLTPIIFIALTATLTAAPLSFNRDIRPILSNNCYQCHGPDSAARKAKLRLDREADSRAERKGGTRAIVPGDLTESELIYRITTDDADEKMPPADSHRKLTAKQIELLKQWVKEGGKYERHWSFIKPKAVPLAKVKLKTWPRNGIDHFILARLEAEGLKPSPEADKATLLRRVSFDLIGLPPTLAQLDAFLADQSPKTFEKAVDRLLASPRYGEHMARYWLDAARYADTNGYQYDTHRDMWPWRDWVINAYNRNLPFDQFTIEQLAGDLLPNATLQQRIATGFNRNHPITIEGGIIDEEYRTEYVIDRVTTSAQVWLGMSFLCARCHDHKFDPVSQKEFYQFTAFFNQVPERGMRGFTPNVKVPAATNPELIADLTTAEQKLKALENILVAAQLQWEKTIITKRQPPMWATHKPSKTTGGKGTTFKPLPDGSTLVGGKSPASETYTLHLHTQQTGLTAIRLECLTHPSLPHNGAGRAFNSNFVLGEFEAEIAHPAKVSKPQNIKFKSAIADFSQNGYNITATLDGKTNTGWAVDGPTRKENRIAVFIADKPFGFEGGTDLQIRLRFNFGSIHSIGRFRIGFTNSPKPDLLNRNTIPTLAAIPPAKRTPAQTQQLRDHFLASAAPTDAKALNEKIRSLRAQRDAQPKTGPSPMVMQDMATPRKTYVLDRGQYDQRREEVSAGTPDALGAMAKNAPRNRLGLARWLVNGQHPLTARVAVNRDWQRLFGEGLVKSTEEFGTQGDWPSHPDLLDWLAVQFVKKEWNQKELIKLIVTSATYRQGSRASAALLAHDRNNRLLARGPRHRLDAEVIRDNALAVSGLLLDKIGGPSVFPYHPKGLWLELNNRPGLSRAYPHAKGEALFRRSLYTYWKRTVPPPSMATFDAPEREFCLVRRSRTNTPLQAFVLLHDPQFVEAARQLAAQMMTAAKEPNARIAHGFRIITARQPNAREQAILQRLYHARLAFYKKNPKAAEALLTIGESKTPETLPATEHAAWTTVARAMMNLSETITKN